jgi:hypothetical protein
VPPAKHSAGYKLEDFPDEKPNENRLPFTSGKLLQKRMSPKQTDGTQNLKAQAETQNLDAASAAAPKIPETAKAPCGNYARRAR